MAVLIALKNLMIELGIVIWVLLGLKFRVGRLANERIQRESRRRLTSPIDKSGSIDYLNCMPKFVRILVVALLAVFAVGSVVHATSTTSMAVKMALADGGPVAMADCTGCEAGDNGNESGLACDLVCTAPFVADLGQGTALSVPVALSIAAPKGVYDFVGRTGPPDPYPPRTLI